MRRHGRRGHLRRILVIESCQVVRDRESVVVGGSFVLSHGLVELFSGLDIISTIYG